MKPKPKKQLKRVIDKIVNNVNMKENPLADFILVEILLSREEIEALKSLIDKN